MCLSGEARNAMDIQVLQSCKAWYKSFFEILQFYSLIDKHKKINVFRFRQQGYKKKGKSLLKLLNNSSK